MSPVATPSLPAANRRHRLEQVALYAIDIEICPEFCGRLRVIACIGQPALIAKFLSHVLARDGATGIEMRAPPGI